MPGGESQPSKAPPQVSRGPCRCTSPSPSPLHSLCMDKQLLHSLSQLHLQPHQWEPRGHATRCPHSLPGSAPESLPQGPMRKQVQFDLGDNLRDMVLLLADLASFLGSATDKRATVSAPTSMSSQCHDTSAHGAQPKTSTTASRKLMAASWALASCSTSPDPMGSP